MRRFPTRVVLSAAGLLVAVAATPMHAGAQPTWRFAEGRIAVVAQGADCPFGVPAALAFRFEWPDRTDGGAELGIVRIHDRYLYPVDELGPAGQRTLTYDASTGSLTAHGKLQLPRRACVLDLESTRLPSQSAGAPELIRAFERLDIALPLFREIRTARRGNTEELERSRMAFSALNDAMGSDHPLTLASAVRMAELSSAIGDYAGATQLLEYAWKSYSAVYAPDDIETLAALDRLLWARRERQVDAGLTTLARQAVALSSARWGERHAQTLRARHTLAAMLSTLGDFEQSLSEGHAVYEARSATLGPEHIDTLRSLANISMDQRAIGQLRDAVNTQRTLHSAFMRTQGPQAVPTLITATNLALTLDDLGDTAAAVALLDANYPNMLITFGPEHPETARTLNALGTLFARSGRFEESVELFQRAAAIRRKTQGPDHPVTLNTLSNQAASLVQLGREVEAAGILRQVVESMERVGLPEDDITLSIRKNYVSALLQSGQGEAARAYASTALAIATPRFPPTKYSVIELRIAAAEAQIAVGKTEAGLQLLTGALADARRELGDEHATTLTAFDATARAMSGAQRPDEAAALLAEAVRAVERARASPLLPPDYRQGLAARWRPHYANLAVHLAASDPPRAFSTSELAKARGLLESIARNRGLAGGALPAQAEAELREFEVRLAKLEQRSAQARDDVTRRTTLEAERNALLRAERERRAELAREYPKFGQLSEPRVVDAASGAAAIAPTAIFVSYLLSDRFVLAFTLDRRGRLRVRQVERPADLDARVEAVRLLAAGKLTSNARRPWRLPDGRIVVAAAPPSGAAPYADLAALCEELGRMLLAPLREELRAHARWIVSPDGTLAVLPFELLKLDGKAAIEQAEISYVQSLSVLVQLTERKLAYRRQATDLSLLVFGNPAYGTAQAPTTVSGSSAALALRSAGAFAPLPASALEIERLAKIFGTDARLYSGSEASESTLKMLNATRQLGRFRYIVFSAHGVMSDESPALSAIVLSQDRVDAIDDGFVTAAEWPQYDMRSDLIFLSACETAAGKVVSGEGVLGLPYALFVAGNTESILTLWKIEDRSAAEFSARLFERIRAGASASHALTQVKRAFLRDPRLSSPFFWAPYVMYGG